MNGLGNPDSPPTTAITLTPVVVDVSRLTGGAGGYKMELSQAGSEVYVKVAGVGTDDGPSIKLTDFHNSNHKDLCEEVEVMKYGVVRCFTKPYATADLIDVAQASLHTVGVKVTSTSTTEYTCTDFPANGVHCWRLEFYHFDPLI